MNCTRSDRELSEDQGYVHWGKVLCEDCLMDIGLSIKECDPWASYVDTHTRERSGLKGAEGLSEMEQNIYEFVKSQGRATRQEVMKNFNLSELDLKSQLIPLMHSELVKERSEGETMYLIPIN